MAGGEDPHRAKMSPLSVRQGGDNLGMLITAPVLAVATLCLNKRDVKGR